MKKKAMPDFKTKVAKNGAYEMLAVSGVRPKAISSKKDYIRKKGKAIPED